MLNKQDSIEKKIQIEPFDKLVKEVGILRKGLLSEICGPPGVGKTQFLTQLCITNSLIYPESSVIYIDTENNFSSKRLNLFFIKKNLKFFIRMVEMAKEKVFSDEDLIRITKNIFVFRKFELTEFEEL